MDPGVRRHAPVYVQTTEFRLDAPAIRTLNTIPVDAVVPPATAIVVPLDCTVIGLVGSLTYSAPPGLQLTYKDLSPQVVVEGSLWDGSARVVNFSPNILTANAPRDAAPYVGVPLQFTSPADVTGGDASYIIYMTYRVIEVG